MTPALRFQEKQRTEHGTNFGHVFSGAQKVGDILNATAAACIISSMTQEPPHSGEVFFTSPPSQVFEVRILQKKGGLGQMFAVGAGLSLMFSLIVLSDLAGDRSDFGLEGVLWTIALCAVLAFGATILLFSLDRGRPSSGTLRLDPDAIRWHWPGAQNVKLPYSDVWSAQSTAGGLLVLQGKESSIALPVQGFADPSAVEIILNDIRTRIGELPDGARRQHELDVRRDVAAPVRKKSTVSLTLAAVLVLVFVAELATGALGDSARLLALGANSAERVAEGEIFRLATANLLHANLLHIVMNVMVLLAVGGMLEHMLGAGRFLTVFLASCLAGAAASALIAQNDLSVGASTGISGLIGAYAVLAWRRPRELSDPPTKGRWISLALSFVLPAILIENVDNAAHLGGFAAGALIALASIRGTDLLGLPDRHRVFFRLSAGILVMVFLAAGVTALS